jgi:hypothetical protein
MAPLFGAFLRRNRLHLVLVLSGVGLAMVESGCATPTEHDLPGDSAGDQGLSGGPTASAGAPSAGAQNAAGAFGSAGSATGGAGAPSGGSPGFGGATNGGGTGLGGAHSAGAASGGSANGGTPSAGAPSAGAPSGGATGSAGNTGGTGCNAAAWTQGKAYNSGDVVIGTCEVIGGGATVCTAGKKYPWTCTGSTCAVYAPGADGWWANWMPGTACN